MSDYDVVIIGGGIQGAGCAQAAAARGYRCLLLERAAAPGLATSSASSKLIHGGLRYLETAQFTLVRECLREQRILLDIAPSLVRLIPFNLPVYKHTKRGRAWIKTGLMLYRLLGARPYESVTRADWRQLDGLTQQDLKGVYRYFDAQTDDQALTAAVVRSAERLGARCLTHAEFIHARQEQDLYRLHYTHQNTATTVRSRAIINAAGPWVNQIIEKIEPPIKPEAIDWVGGSHIILPGELMQGAYYVEAHQDGRAVFILPSTEGIMVGTTETLYQSLPDPIAPTQLEIDYLLRVYNDYFRQNYQEADIIRSFSGLRVMHRSGKAANKRSRHSIIHAGPRRRPPFYTLYGGKLTAYRQTATEVLDKLARRLPPKNAGETSNIQL